MRHTPFLLFCLILAAPPQPGHCQENQPQEGMKSVGVALALGVGATLLPLVAIDGPGAALGATSFLVGPAAGLIYAGAIRRGLISTGVRVASAIAVAATFDIYDDGSGSDGAIATVGAVVFLGSYALDFLAIPYHVRNHNQRLTVSPVVESGGRMGVRVRVGWSW